MYQNKYNGKTLKFNNCKISFLLLCNAVTDDKDKSLHCSKCKECFNMRVYNILRQSKIILLVWVNYLLSIIKRSLIYSLYIFISFILIFIPTLKCHFFYDCKWTSTFLVFMLNLKTKTLLPSYKRFGCFVPA